MILLKSKNDQFDINLWSDILTETDITVAKFLIGKQSPYSVNDISHATQITYREVSDALKNLIGAGFIVNYISPKWWTCRPPIHKKPLYRTWNDAVAMIEDQFNKQKQDNVDTITVPIPTFVGIPNLDSLCKKYLEITGITIKISSIDGKSFSVKRTLPVVVDTQQSTDQPLDQQSIDQLLLELQKQITKLDVVLQHVRFACHKMKTAQT